MNFRQPSVSGKVLIHPTTTVVCCHLNVQEGQMLAVSALKIALALSVPSAMMDSLNLRQIRLVSPAKRAPAPWFLPQLLD
jgi:hypothetical protein